MMALSPQEQTWAQLQENFQRKRQEHGVQHGRQYNRYQKAPPVPLSRILDSPTDAPLRGSHYPVIPPVANDRYFNDDTFSLQSYNSDLGHSEDYNNGLPLYLSQPPNPPYPYNGTTRAHHLKPQANLEPWNSSTRVRGARRPFVQSRDSSIGYSTHPPGKHRQMYFDGSGYQRRGMGRGKGMREGHVQGRHVWRDPLDDAELQDDSATVVQRHFRGYKTRKNLNLLHHLQNPSYSLSFMHHFLKDVLQNDLILDVACDVLTEERTRGQKHTEAMYMTSSSCMVAYKASNDPSFWEEALDRPEIYEPIASSLIMEVLHEETRIVTSDGINKLLEDYFESKLVADTTQMIMTDVVVDMISDLFEESRMEVVTETIADEFIDAETQVCVSGFLQETFLRGTMPLDAAEEQLEIKEVARLAENALLEATLLDHLLSIVVCNGQIWSQLEDADRFLDDQLLEILLGQYVGILHNRKATEECVPLKRLHEKIVTEVALDTILSELTDQLQEDLEDVDEYERG